LCLQLRILYSRRR